jgi:dihydrofolate reductase
MSKLIYSIGVSLDGFIAGPGGEIDWAAPDPELHRFHNEQMREAGLHLLGRRLYETMVHWETADRDPSSSPIEREFAEIWQRLPKVVFSGTLHEVVGNTKLMRGGLVEEATRLKQEQGPDVAIGGAGLASSLVELGLIDEYRLFISPVVLGGGTPFFPPLERPLALERIETREFGRGVVYLRYRAV